MGILLAVLASLFWGLAPVIAKVALERVPPVLGLGIRSLITAVIILTWVLATGHHRQISAVDWRSFTWVAVEAVVSVVLGDTFYYYAIKHAPPTQVSLVTAASPLFTLFVAVVLMGEQFTLQKMLGATLVVVGIWLFGIY